MPSTNNVINLTDELPIKTFDSASFQINGGSSIAGGTLYSEAQAFTQTVAVTGLVATDARLAVRPRDAIVIPPGLQLISVTAGAGTMDMTWKNTTLSAITPPAAGVWSVAVLGNFLRG